MRKSAFTDPYDAGKQTVLTAPRWKFYVLVIAGIAIGSVVKAVLISRYSLPRSEAYFFATVAVVLWGLVGAIFIAFGSGGVGRGLSSRLK